MKLDREIFLVELIFIAIFSMIPLIGGMWLFLLLDMVKWSGRHHVL